VKGAEFERRVRKLARKRKVPCQFVADKGKGSHGRLYFGGEFITLKDQKKEIGRDLPMSRFSYPAKFTTGGDGRVLVEFVDLPRVATDGKDEREAMEEAIGALGSDLSICLSRREEIRSPTSARRGQRLIPVPLWLAPKLALYLAMRDQRLSNSELARRMLDPEHATKAEKIQAALAVLGKQMIVEVRDAA